MRHAIHRLFRTPNSGLRGLDTSVAAGLAADEPQELDREWELEWMDAHYRRAMGEVRKTADPKSVIAFEHLLAGETPDEVAQRLGMKRDAVHKVKQRIRDRLKRQIAKQVEEEETFNGRAAS